VSLVARGLKETATAPDLLVDFRITGSDISTTQRGMSIGGPGFRGRPMASSGPQPLRFTEGTLVIDLSRAAAPTPIWRGVYRDDESTGSKLVEKLPADAKKLLERYPPPKPKR
jgi:hypothetical protein